MRGTRYPSAEGHPPLPPLQRGEERSEAHEALTFWLLLGQAKSNGKEIMSGFQPSKQGMGVDTPPLQDGAEIYRAFSPWASGELTPSGR